MRKVQCRRQTWGKMRTYWASIGGVKELADGVLLSTFPWKICGGGWNTCRQGGGGGKADLYDGNVIVDLSKSRVTSPRLAYSRSSRLASKDRSNQRLFELRAWHAACRRNRGWLKKGEMCRGWIEGCRFLRNWDRSSSAVVFETCQRSIWARPNEGQPLLAGCQGWWNASWPVWWLFIPKKNKN